MKMIEGRDTPVVNHPAHYNDYPIECIEMMRRIWGDEVVAQWCIITAFKYRMRAGHKDNIATDLAKEKWYLGKASELKGEESDEDKRDYRDFKFMER